MADELKPFACTYRFEGRPIGITVEARSLEEVSARLRSIGMTAVVEGELVATIPVPSATGAWKRMKAAARSLLRGPIEKE